MQHSRTGVLAGTRELGESLSALRLSEPGAELAMERSLLREGQVTPVVCYRAGERVEVIDGFYAEFATMRSLDRPWPLRANGTGQ